MSLLDPFVRGLFARFLNGATPDECSEDIRLNRRLATGVSDEEWTRYRAWASKVPGIEINYKLVLDSLAQFRPDLLAVIVSTPNGIDWLKSQVRYFRVKLGMEKAKFVS